MIDFGKAVETDKERGAAMGGQSTIGCAIEKHYAKAIQVLEKLCESVDVETLDRAAKAITVANRVLFYPDKGSAGVALTEVNEFLAFGKNACFLLDDYQQKQAIRFCGANDTVLGVCRDGSDRNVVDALRMARSNGTSTILISPPHNLIASHYADVVLVIPSHNSQSLFSSAEISLCQTMMIQTLLFQSLHTELAEGRPAKNSRESISSL